MGGEIRGLSDYEFRTVVAKLCQTHRELFGNIILIRIDAEPGFVGQYGYRKELCVCLVHTENVMAGKESGCRAEPSMLKQLAEKYTA